MIEAIKNKENELNNLTSFEDTTYNRTPDAITHEKLLEKQKLLKASIFEQVEKELLLLDNSKSPFYFAI